MKNRYLVALILLVSPMTFTSAAWAANDANNQSGLNQDHFKDLTSDLGDALSYKALSPTEPLGDLGFDLGFDFTSTRLETNALEQANTGNGADSLLIPKLHIHKGLPLGFGVSAFYGSSPDSNIDLIGGELRYAIYNGGTYTPRVSIRGTYSQLTGVDDLSLSTRGLELSVSKGFAMFTPYAGISTMWIESDTNVSGLTGENISENKYFMGFKLNLGQMNISAETEKTDEEASTKAKIGVRF